MYNILVTGIGGNVGQGILRNIRACNIPVQLTGTNTVAFSAGNHLCDKVYEVPYAYADNYITVIQNICKKEDIHLIIPSTDYETYYLSLNKDVLPKVAASPSSTSHIFLDKYRTWECFQKHQIPFAESVLPEDYQINMFDEYIVKPREGRGSRGIYINPEYPERFSKEYLIQKLYKGKEITSSFYVTRNQQLHGAITLERELAAGATSLCQVVQSYDEQVLRIIEKMMVALPIQGSCNVQSIVTDSGEIIPFEINGRISGTNSIRSQFGFKDVWYTIQELLLDQQPDPVNIQPGCAVRIMMDIIYPDNTVESPKNLQTQHYLF